jgi:hypothetical protein
MGVPFCRLPINSSRLNLHTSITFAAAAFVAREFGVASYTSFLRALIDGYYNGRKGTLRAVTQRSEDDLSG